jgi:PST family polysaccharide transporter
MPAISIKKAALITAISKYSTVIVNIIFSAILSRILTPGDYGVVAIVGVFTNFFGVLSNMGLGTSVIQYKELSTLQINHIYSFSLYVSLLLAAVFALLSIPISIFYNNNVYVPIGCILSISVFFNSLNMIPNAVLMREKRFLLVGIRLIIVSILTSLFTIMLALLGMKYYALAFQSVLSAVFAFLWNKKTSGVKFQWNIDFNNIKNVRHYSSYQFGDNFINYFTRNLDKLLIGKLMGDIPLAQYDKAYKWMLYPVQNLTHVITPTLHPFLSDHQNNKEYIYTKYLKIIKFLSIFGVLVTAICFWCNKEIIIIVFGNQWHSAAVILRWLSLSIWSQMITSSSGTVFQSIGNTKLLFFDGIASSAVTVICIITGILISAGDLETVAKFISLGFCCSFFINYFFLIKIGFKRKFYSFLLEFKYDLFVFLICMVSGYFLEKIIQYDSLFVSFIIKSILIGIVFIFFSAIIYKNKFKAVLKSIFNKIITNRFFLLIKNRFLPKKITDLSYNKTYTLTIPTYEKSGQAVHPDILYDVTNNKPNFILTFTPYPFSNDKYENPSILVSLDGLRFFEEFPRLNPLAPVPAFDHNNDPDIFYYENCLNIIYLETLRPEKQNLILLSSIDRRTWNSRIVHTDYIKENDPMIVSPCYFLINNTSYLYYVNISEPIFKIQYVTIEKNFSPNFNQRIDIDIPLKNINPWHIDVFSSGNYSYMLICSVTAKRNKKNYKLHIARSINGHLWELSETTVLNNAYRSTGFIRNNEIYIYYSRQNALFSNWEIGIVKFKINKFFTNPNIN